MKSTCIAGVTGIDIVDIRQWDENEELLLGTVYILGVPHHVEFLRVEDDDNGCQRAVKDPYDRYGAWQNYYEGRYQTVKVPGFEGEWIVAIFPYC